jgi:hypothetical protein
MTNDLTGKTVIDANRREYTVERHVTEADELVLKRGNETHAITTMDIADGPFEVQDD